MGAMHAHYPHYLNLRLRLEQLAPQCKPALRNQLDFKFKLREPQCPLPSGPYAQGPGVY